MRNVRSCHADDDRIQNHEFFVIGTDGCMRADVDFCFLAAEQVAQLTACAIGV